MKLSAYECRVILLTVSLCWGSALHPARDTEMTGHGWGLYVVEKQSCPTWYRETKHNGVTRCVCGAIMWGVMLLPKRHWSLLAVVWVTMKQSVTVIGGCPFSYHYPDDQTFYVNLPNDTSELNSFMCSGFDRTGLFCSQCQLRNSV